MHHGMRSYNKRNDVSKLHLLKIPPSRISYLSRLIRKLSDDTELAQLAIDISKAVLFR